jgi:hypothetical protein
MKKLLYILLALLLLIGCRTKYITVPEYHQVYATQHKTDSIRDSVFLHDSVYVDRKGDTVFVSKFHTLFKDRLKYVNSVDTLMRSDSIRVPYPVERSLTKWEKLKMDYGAVAIGVSLAALVIVISYVVRWLLRKRIV